MRRAALQAFRSARRPCLRKFARSRTVTFPPSNGLGPRHFSRPRASLPVLASSMQLRTFTGALVAAAVASGAFYAYRGNPPASTASTAEQRRSASSDAVEPTRRALVVDQGSLYTGTITGSGPLSKETDDYGRKVLEMLTPEQATAKLRKNEESWLVGRGAGVVRYDVVQSMFFPSSSCPPSRMFWAGTPVISPNMKRHLFPPQVVDFTPSRPHHQDGRLSGNRCAGLACLALPLRHIHEGQASCLCDRAFHA